MNRAIATHAANAVISAKKPLKTSIVPYACSSYDHKRTCENAKPKMSGINMMQRVLEPVTYTSSPATVTCIPCFVHPTSTGMPASQHAVLAIHRAASRESQDLRRIEDLRTLPCTAVVVATNKHEKSLQV